MNIQQEIKELRTKLEQLEKECKDKEEPEWPKEGDIYYYFNASGNIIPETWAGDGFDTDVKGLGCIFKTQEEAASEIEARKVVAELRATEGRVAAYTPETFENANTHRGVEVFSGSVKVSSMIFSFFLVWKNKDYAQQAINKVGEARIIAAAKHFGRM